MSITKWFITAKIKLSDEAYLSYMATEINYYNILRDNFISNGNKIDNEIITTPKSNNIFSPINFFANELIESKLNLKHNLLHLCYNEQSGYLEFVNRVEIDSKDPSDIYLKLATIISSSAFIDTNVESICILSSVNLDNIRAYFLLSKDSIISIPKDIIPKTVPTDIAVLYHNATNSISTNIFASKSTDPDILNKFYRLVNEKLAVGTDNIIGRASMENLEILTSDALYFTDGINVLTRYGEIVSTADPHTFTSLGGYYSKDKKNIYYGTDIINGADHNTFIRIGNDYAKDKIYAYYKGEPFTNITPTFKVHRPSDGYVTDSNYVYHNGKKLDGSDASSFHCIGEPLSLDGIYFGVDKNQVYLDGKIINNINPKTFKHISKHFFKDDKNVYSYSNIIENCSPKNVRVLNRFYITSDEKKIFFIIGKNTTTLIDADPKSARVNKYFLADKKSVYFKGIKLHSLIGAETDISDDFNDGYIYDKTSVFFFNTPLLTDRASFKQLGFGYAKDNFNIYFRDILINGVDLSSFSPISYGYATDNFATYNGQYKIAQNTYLDKQCISQNYYKNETNIYYKDREIRGANFNTFNQINDSDHPDMIEGYTLKNLLSSEYEMNNKFITNFAFDKNNIYFKDKIIKDADATTFKVFDKPQTQKISDSVIYSRLYSKDKNNIYYKNESIKLADVDSFKPHKLENIWTDNQYIYLDGEIITYIDLQTFEHIAYNFYKDKKSVYYEIDILENITLNNLSVLHKNYIQDDKNIHYINKLKDTHMVRNIFAPDRKTFTISDKNNEFSYDKNNLFFMGKEIPDINIQYVKFLGGRYFKTDKHVYYASKQIPVEDIKKCILLPDNYLYDGSYSYYKYDRLNTTTAIRILGFGYATDGEKYWKNGIEIDNIETDPYLRNSIKS